MKNLPVKGFGLIGFGATMIFGSLIPMIASSISSSSTYYSGSMMGTTSSVLSLGFLIGAFAFLMFVSGLISAVCGLIVILSRKEN